VSGAIAFRLLTLEEATWIRFVALLECALVVAEQRQQASPGYIAGMGCALAAPRSLARYALSAGWPSPEQRAA
jgi:hypothetical protein